MTLTLFLLFKLLPVALAQDRGFCYPVFENPLPVRIAQPVHGLFDSIKIDPRLPEVTLETDQQDDKSAGGELVASNFTTYIWMKDKGGSWRIKGRFFNTYFYQEQTFSHMEAHLNAEVPKFIDVPDVCPLIPGRGVPLQAYTNLQHMKLAHIQPGGLAIIETGQIVNSRTLQEIERMESIQAWLVNHGFEPLPFEEIAKVIGHTHTGMYIETVAIQSNHRIKKAHAVPFQFDYKRDKRMIRPFSVVFELESWI